MKQCPACGANNSPDAPSCSICGAALGQVASDVAARTLFGMPAVKIDRPKPASAPAPTPPPVEPRTRPGFRALDAVELDGSVGSMNAQPDGLAQTTVGMARPGGFPVSDGPGAFDDEPDDAANDGPKSTLFGAPSPFKSAGAPIESDAPEPVDPPSLRAPIESTRHGMPSVNLTPPPGAVPAAAAVDYSTLLGPPKPLAEVMKARDAARQSAPPPADDFRTLVGPPGSIAEAARARDAARDAARAAERSAREVPASRQPAPASPSIIVDQQAFAHSLAAENAGPSVIVDPGLDAAEEAPVIVDDPPASRSSLRPLPGDADPRRGEPPATAEVKRPDRDAERAAARFAQTIADSDTRVERPSQAWVWLVVLIVLAAIAFAVWFSREAYTGDAALHAPSDQAVAGAGEAGAPR